jgi:uncharacterized membrane-anchored protein
MKAWIVAGVAALQIGALAWMAGEREWILRTGKSVYVRTAPVDPRDPMRGDYVRLDYEVSTVPRSLCRDGLAAIFEEKNLHYRAYRDRRVYALLKPGEGGVVQLEALTDREPESGLFMRGRIDSHGEDEIRVRYGIEALFTEQGAARRFEDEVRGDKAGVPVNAEVALGDGGIAVLRGYRWEPLGITIVLHRDVATTGEPVAVRPRSAAIQSATVTLKNHSESPVAIVDLPGGASFRFVPVERWRNASYVGVERPSRPAPTSADVIVLQPGQVHVVELDLTRPEWFVSRVTKADPSPEAPQSIASLVENWEAWFRLEYAPPSREACASLPHAEAIRHAPLRSRAFGASGGVD